jgi:hypothetical protein
VRTVGNPQSAPYLEVKRLRMLHDLETPSDEDDDSSPDSMSRAIAIQRHRPAGRNRS